MNDVINILQIMLPIKFTGEVINRPSSVVKELIDNSIDAKSTAIKILIENGGKKSIKIIDNGFGILSMMRKLHLRDIQLQN